MGVLKYSMDILAPKHKITINYKGKFSPSIIRNMPDFLASVLGIPLYKVYEDVIMWDTSSGDRISFFCKWTALETEIDPHSIIKIIIEARGYYFPKEGNGNIQISIKGFVETTFEYFTPIDKKLKEQYAKTLYQKRRIELRKIGKLYIERIDRALRELLGIGVET